MNKPESPNNQIIKPNRKTVKKNNFVDVYDDILFNKSAKELLEMDYIPLY